MGYSFVCLSLGMSELTPEKSRASGTEVLNHVVCYKCATHLIYLKNHIFWRQKKILEVISLFKLPFL